jgi:hypothetical protein
MSLAAGVHKDDTLGNGQGLVQVTASIQLPLFLLHIDTVTTSSLNPHGLVDELAGNLKGLRGHGSREHQPESFMEEAGKYHRSAEGIDKCKFKLCITNLNSL